MPHRTLVALLIVLVAACGSSTPRPTGTAPPRVVSLSVAGTELLAAVGAGAQVVGDRPDVVIADATSAVPPDVRVVRLWPQASLEDTYAQLRLVGRATGHAAQAEGAVQRIKDGVASVLRAVGDKANGVTYYHEVDGTQLSVRSRTFVGQVYAMLGMVDIADGASTDRLPGAFITERDPDFVFLADPAQAPSTFAARPGFAALGAVRAGRVVTLAGNLTSPSGVHAADLLRAIGEAVSKA